MNDRIPLTRQFIEAGGIDALLELGLPDLPRLSDEELDSSLADTLKKRPDGDVWLFGYGSIIWNPTIRSLQTRIVQAKGWYRSFCLANFAGRGTPDQPGLVLGLSPGGECNGVAFRLEDGRVEEELKILWRREMVLNSYVPRWIDLLDARGFPFTQGLAFTANPDVASYVGHLSEAEIVQRLANAKGVFGTSADYLRKTCESLRALGIPDRHLESLWAEVKRSS